MKNSKQEEWPYPGFGATISLAIGIFYVVVIAVGLAIWKFGG